MRKYTNHLLFFSFNIVCCIMQRMISAIRRWNYVLSRIVVLPKMDVSMSKSDINDTFNYPYPKSGHYYDYEVTLHKVENGNFQTQNISEEEMFN